MRYLLITVSLLLHACSGQPHALQYSEDKARLKNNTVYITSHGWHTGFVIASDKVLPTMPFLGQRFLKTAYFEFGWGDHDFYQENEVTSGITLKAALWPTDAVMHVVAVAEPPEEYFHTSEIVKFSLSDKALDSLLKYIHSSFYFDKDNNVTELKYGLYGDSQFYQAVGVFSIFNTCNIWTAKGLESTGFDIWPATKFTAGSVMSFIREHAIYSSP